MLASLLLLKPIKTVPQPQDLCAVWYVLPHILSVFLPHLIQLQLHPLREALPEPQPQS